jgi:HD-GYP domain-containing protein (c-di-GMP phosphodiesterase class II)
MEGSANLSGRIIAMADTHANMLSGHSIAAARTPEQALDELSKMSGTGFDGMLVRLLLRELRSERASSAKDSF